MKELISTTRSIISRSKKLMTIEAVAKTVENLFTWIGNTLGGKTSALEILEKAKNGEASIEEVNEVVSRLAFFLEDDHDLQKELTAKIEEVKKTAEKKGVSLTSKTKAIDVSRKGKFAIKRKKVKKPEKSSGPPDQQEFIDLDEPFDLPDDMTVE